MVSFVKYRDIEFSNNSKYVKSKIDFGNMTTVSNDIEFIDCDGVVKENVYFKTRTITIRGWINAQSYHELLILKRKLNQCIDPKKEYNFYYKDEITNIYAPCFANISWGEKHSNLQDFIIYFEVPSFYFLSVKVHEYSLFNATGLLTMESILPCIFSTRRNKVNIFNNGDVDTDFILKIVVKDVDGICENNELNVKNNTTGDFIKLEYTLTDGEEITIDTQNTSIISSVNGNILSEIVEESTFFKLAVGDNEIECLNYDNSKSISCIMTFNEKFRMV